MAELKLSSADLHVAHAVISRLGDDKRMGHSEAVKIYYRFGEIDTGDVVKDLEQAINEQPESMYVRSLIALAVAETLTGAKG